MCPKFKNLGLRRGLEEVQKGATSSFEWYDVSAEILQILSIGPWGAKMTPTR
jgi:hypothetical protein